MAGCIKNGLRILYLLAVALTWLAALFLAMECGQRLYIRYVQEDVGRLWADHVQAGHAQNQHWIDTAIADAQPPPRGLSPDPDAPPRLTWDALSEPGDRAQFAKDREEAIFLCDRTGLKREGYLPESPAALRECAAQGGNAGPIWAILGEDAAQSNDARDTFQAVCGGGPPQMREYQLQRADGTLYAAEFYFAPYPSTERPPALVSLFVRESMYEIPWCRLRPHKYRDDTVAGWVIWTNNAGFRGPDIVLPKPAGAYRILCVGGSTTFEGVRNHLTYPAILQRKLRKHFNTDRIEVVNGGVNAINSDQELKQFPNYLAIQPDLIVHYNFVNDISIILKRIEQHDAANRMAKIRALASGSTFLQCHLPSLLAVPEQALQDTIESFTLKNECAMMEQARQHGVEWVACSFAYPDISRLDASQRRSFMNIYNPGFFILGGLESYIRAVTFYNRRIQECAGRAGNQYIPVAERLSTATDCFEDVCHLYANGIAEKADIIFEHLRPRIATDRTTADDRQ